MIRCASFIGFAFEKELVTPVNESWIVLRGVEIRSPRCGHNRIYWSHSILELSGKEESQRDSTSVRHNTTIIKHTLSDICRPVVPTPLIGVTVLEVFVKPLYIYPGGVDLVCR